MISFPTYHTIALIVAAGRGSRSQSPIPKQYLPLAGKPLLRHSAQALSSHPRIDAICVVYHPDDAPLYLHAMKGIEALPPVAGGETRQESVYRGLQSLMPYRPTQVLIHDAARPFLSDITIDRVMDAIAPNCGVIPVISVDDTIKQFDASGALHTIDRSQLVRAQTPQGFMYDNILHAHTIHAGKPMTDDAAIYEALGYSITTVPGSSHNFKITTSDDLQLAQKMVTTPTQTRTGLGFDVHAFCAPASTLDNTIMLCGVAVPHSMSLKGHSDADVGLHALTDALLGSISDGDIGEHFSDKNPAFRNMDSAFFLTTAKNLVTQAGGDITHVDITLIGESPKVSPYRMAMRTRIASMLEMDISRVSVKATTTEGLGFTGRREGLAAQAVASVVFTM